VEESDARVPRRLRGRRQSLKQVADAHDRQCAKLAADIEVVQGATPCSLLARCPPDALRHVLAFVSRLNDRRARRACIGSHARDGPARWPSSTRSHRSETTSRRLAAAPAPTTPTGHIATRRAQDLQRARPQPSDGHTGVRGRRPHRSARHACVSLAQRPQVCFESCTAHFGPQSQVSAGAQGVLRRSEASRCRTAPSRRTLLPPAGFESNPEAFRHMRAGGFQGAP